MWGEVRCLYGVILGGFCYVFFMGRFWNLFLGGEGEVVGVMVGVDFSRVAFSFV